MMIFTQDQWLIVALVFVLGLLIGMFMTSGGRRKWKTRYRDEVTRRETLESEHQQRARDWDNREKEWREQDSLRGAALKDRSGATASDVDGDGVSDNRDRRPTDDRTA